LKELQQSLCQVLVVKAAKGVMLKAVPDKMAMAMMAVAASLKNLNHHNNKAEDQVSG
jgi:hypothetical protein